MCLCVSERESESVCVFLVLHVCECMRKCLNMCDVCESERENECASV